MLKSKRKLSTLQFLRCLFCFLMFLLPHFSTAKSVSTDIRINVLKETPSIHLLAEGASVWDAKQPHLLFKLPDRKPIIVSWQALGMLVDNRLVRAEKIIIRAKPQTFHVKGKTFRGELEITRNEKGGLMLVNRLDLEQYLVGLINHEVSSSWPEESLKAQAVVARTYALYRKNQNKYVDYDLESNTLDQVYGGSSLEDKRSLEAVRATAGEVLTHDNEVIPAFYHSCCGGHTEIAQYVWGGNYGGITAVACPYCHQAPSFFWVHEVTANQLHEQLDKAGFPLPRLSHVRILRATPFGRALTIEVAGGGKKYQLSGNQFRSAAGFQNLKSTYFRLNEERKSFSKNSLIRFIGGGNGHGVGMCQWGARGMAEENHSYKEILKHYYPDANLHRYRRFSS